MSGNPRIPNSDRTLCDDRPLLVALHSRGNSTRQTNIGTSLLAHKTKVPEFVLKTSWFDYIANGADFKRLSKAIARLQLIWLLINLKVIAWNSDWFISLFIRVAINRSIYFDIGFSPVF